MPTGMLLKANMNKDESQPAEDNKDVANNPQMPDVDDLLGTEFAKFLEIDMS